MDSVPVAERPQPVPPSDLDLADESTAPAPSITLTADDLADIEGLQALHARRTADHSTDHPADRTDGTAADQPVSSPEPPASDDVAARCPIPAALTGGAAACPVGAGGVTTSRPVQRSNADLFMRRLLRVSDPPVNRTDAITYQAFRRSMMISAVRCTLTYVVFPLILPMLSFASGVGSVIGVVIGSVALVCDTFVIRRFFAVDHRYRWPFTAIVASIMVLLSVLLVQDLVHIAQSLS